MKTVILCGGKGTRLSEETGVRPKPMVEVGEWPILWHIMQLFSHYQYTDFCLALGYKQEYIKDYFINFYSRANNFEVNLKSGNVNYLNSNKFDWNVSLIDTGDETLTGGRIARLKEHIGNETFMLTYGDGVCDVNIADLVKFHKSHGKLATVTAVRPPARFGEMIFDGDTVKEFKEKPRASVGWINGGFFVLEPGVFEYIKGGDSCIFEKEPLEQLALSGQLVAYRHEGFWQCMDTLRDKKLLNDIWQSGDATWWKHV